MPCVNRLFTANRVYMPFALCAVCPVLQGWSVRSLRTGDGRDSALGAALER